MTLTLYLEPMVGGRARVKPSERLEGDDWLRYAEASKAAGVTYDTITRLYSLSAAKVPEYAQLMQQAGYTLSVHPDIAAGAKREREEALRLASFASARAEEAARHGKPLREYQKVAAGWMASRPGGILADGMGLGKSCSVVFSWAPNTPVLIVCPKVAVSDWVYHVNWRSSEFTPQVVKTRGSFRWPEPGEALIVNYAKLPPASAFTAEDSPLRLSCPPGLEVDIDEAQLAKNKDSARGAACYALAGLATRRWAITGTPIDNYPPDLLALVRLVRVEQESWTTEAAFYRDFGGDPDASKSAQGWSRDGVADHVPTILKRIMLRREKRDVAAELPDKTWKHVRVEIPPHAAAIADEAVAALAAAGIEVAEKHPADCPCLACKVDLAQRTQAGPIPGFGLLARARAALALAKTPALLELVELMEQDTTPMVVWCCHKEPLEAVAARAGWDMISGEVNHTVKQRQRVREAFQAGQLRGLAVMQHEEVGVSMTLTAAYRSVHVDMPYKASTLEQCEDRIHRIGQKNHCEYTYLVADHKLDRWITALVGRKQGIERAAIGAAAVKGSELLTSVLELDPALVGTPQKDARRCARPRERMIAAWLESSTDRVARAMAEQQRRHGGLTDAQWVQCARLAAGIR